MFVIYNSEQDWHLWSALNADVNRQKQSYKGRVRGERKSRRETDKDTHTYTHLLMKGKHPSASA